MKLVNPIICDDFISRAFGLMFKRKPETMVFIFKNEKKVPLHMMFVFFPIDVAYLDSRNNIVELVKGLKPFRFYNPKFEAKYVVEFPDGTIEEERLKVGNKILF